MLTSSKICPVISHVGRQVSPSFFWVYKTTICLSCLNLFFIILINVTENSFLKNVLLQNSTYSGSMS
jgi:hypothetical protein